MPITVSGLENGENVLSLVRRRLSSSRKSRPCNGGRFPFSRRAVAHFQTARRLERRTP